jgi:hypothetical protein
VRIRFTVPATLKADVPLVLDLGTVHDFDETWLNGVRLGGVTPETCPAEDAWRTPRRYALPAGLVAAGTECVVAIRAWNRRTDPAARTLLAGPFRLRPA